VLAHPPYLPDVAPSDYHLFRSMQHGLLEMHFTSYEDVRKWVASGRRMKEQDKEFFIAEFTYCPKDGLK
jgi:hypothetical protein